MKLYNMAMTPQEKREFDEMKEIVKNLKAVTDVGFIESIKRRLDINGEVRLALNQTNIGDLGDVDTTGVSNGQVLKYDSGDNNWQPANDNVA